MNSMMGGNASFSMLPFEHAAYCFSDGSWCADGQPSKEVPVTNTGYIYPEGDGGLGNAGYAFSTFFEGPGTNP